MAEHTYVDRSVDIVKFIKTKDGHFAVGALNTANYSLSTATILTEHDVRKLIANDPYIKRSKAVKWKTALYRRRRYF